MARCRDRRQRTAAARDVRCDGDPGRASVEPHADSEGCGCDIRCGSRRCRRARKDANSPRIPRPRSCSTGASRAGRSESPGRSRRDRARSANSTSWRRTVNARARAIAGEQGEPIDDLDARPRQRRSELLEANPDFVPADWVAYRVTPGPSSSSGRPSANATRFDFATYATPTGWVKDILWP